LEDWGSTVGGFCCGPVFKADSLRAPEVPDSVLPITDGGRGDDRELGDD
jgi:hypothetical protein